jgi:hypothetical protein
VQDRVNGMFDKKSLPMYKDKPYNFQPSSRRRPLWKRKRVLGPVAFATCFLLYLLGFFSSSNQDAPASSKWQWRAGKQEKGASDWNKRRESVVEAFQLSWDTYAKNGWGMFKLYHMAATRRLMFVYSQVSTSTTPLRRHLETWRQRASAGLSLTRSTQ